MNRPIFIITIGYIIGILWGLYFRISIALLYVVFFIIYIITKILNQKEILKKVIKLNIIMTIIISSLISNLIINKLNNKYETLYKDKEELKLQVIVVSNKKDKQYYYRYKVKVLTEKYKNTSLYMTTKKELDYGDILEITGEFDEPSGARNYKGFDYKQYLKILGISGTIRANYINKEGKEYNILYYANLLHLKIKENIEKTYNQNSRPVILGVMLGDTSEINEETREDFSESSISHVLAISGLHVSYIIYLVQISSKKIFGEKKSQIISIIVLLIYMSITGFGISVVRASIMGILMCISFLVYRKSDSLNNLSISCLIILIKNPFNILSTSFLFTYAGTIGVVFFRTIIQENIENIKIKNKKVQEKYLKFCKKHNYLIEAIAVAISAQLMTFPIIIIKYNMINLSFIITNLLICIVIGPLVIGGFVQIVITFISIKIGSAIAQIVQLPVQILILISKIGKNMTLINFKVITPDNYQIIIYYICLSIYYYLNQKKIKIKIKPKIKKIIVLIILASILINKIPHNLEIYFVDVSQGDCSFIVTPNNKTILIDGGGQRNFDVGKNTLLPYIFDRKKSQIDYCIISHFDFDHCGGILYIMNEIKIKKMIIPKQFEDSENYQEFKKIVNMKKINVIEVEAGQRIKIEKDLYLDILWPCSENIVNQNVLNNNSLVFKLVNKNFSILYTGDIEEIAEKAILKKYSKNLNVLEANILKVAHHGSKTSSTIEFIQAVKPQIALIGVGENNTFGHPSENTLNKLENINCKIYRTDELGEICINVKSKGIITIKGTIR